jgi:hypothetical protein
MDYKNFDQQAYENTIEYLKILIQIHSIGIDMTDEIKDVVRTLHVVFGY